MSYCPNCDHWVDFSDSFSESDTWSYDEDEVYHAPTWSPPRSGLKRARSDTSDPNPRPVKRICREGDIDRSDAPVYDGMDVDDEMQRLTDRMAAIVLD